MLTALIRKEWLALARDLHGLAALFVMPMVFIIVMSLALKNVYRPPVTSLAYAVDVREAAPLSAQMIEAWQRDHGAPRALPADWSSELRAGRLKYVLVLEPGLAEELAQPGLPQKARLRLLAEPGMDANLFNTLRAELGALAGEVKARHLLRQSDLPAPAADASMLKLIDAQRHAAGGPHPSAVQQNVPAWLVFGMFFVVASIAGLLVQERSSGALARLQSLGVPRHLFLLSKALPYLGVNGIQAALMLAVGVWLMPLLGGDALSLAGIHWDALVLALAAVSAAAIGLALALACAVRSHAQASAIGPILNVLMAAVGGIMVPKFVMPDFMQKLAALSPMNWGLEALLTVLSRGGTAAQTLPHVIPLAGFALAMFAIALVLFRRHTP